MSTEVGTGGWAALRPHFVRHFLLPGLAGAVAGCVGVGALLALDLGGLRTLALADGAGWIAVPLLCLGFAVTFASAAIGASVMAIGQD
jgi:hypothetical protein